MQQARLASFLQWSKSSLSLFLKKGGKCFQFLPFGNKIFPCVCACMCASAEVSTASLSQEKVTISSTQFTQSNAPKIELFLTVSWIVVFTPLPASRCIFYEIIELDRTSKLHFWLTVPQTPGMCVKYEYHWKEYTPDPKLTVGRVAHPDTFAFI